MLRELHGLSRIAESWRVRSHWQGGLCLDQEPTMFQGEEVSKFKSRKAWALVRVENGQLASDGIQMDIYERNVEAKIALEYWIKNTLRIVRVEIIEVKK
jgi:hypothetical protein